jgi:hypothetical protein
MSYLCYYFVFVTYSDVQCVLTILATWRVSYKGHELLTLREHLCSPPVFVIVSDCLLFSNVYLEENRARLPMQLLRVTSVDIHP